MSTREDSSTTAEIALVEHAANGAPSPTVVYILAGRPDGAVKVGITKHPTKRLAQIQRGMHEVFREPIVMSDFIILSRRDAAVAVEADAHAILADQHTGVGEWFYCTPEEAMDAVHVAIGLPL